MVERKDAADERDSFLGRWSRRKADARQGLPLVESPLPAADPQAPQVPAVGDGQIDAEPSRKYEAPPPLSLADVEVLTTESDFSPFMARGVVPGVRNAAMKKLFADPRYNVMDGLDTYIDDYTKTTPLTTAVLRQMVSARALGLFDEEEERAEVSDDGTADPQAAARTEPGPQKDDSLPAGAAPQSSVGDPNPGASADEHAVSPPDKWDPAPT